LDVGLSGIRLIVTLLVLFWVQDLLAKDIERKNVLWSLAFPAGRTVYLLGRFLGIAILSLLALGLLGLLLNAVLHFTGIFVSADRPPNLGGAFWLTLAYTWLDMLVVAAFACLIAMFSTSSLMPLAMGVGFAVSARSIGSVVAYLLQPDSKFDPIFLVLIRKIEWIIPDLSRLDLRDICLYDQSIPIQALTYALLMAASYIGLMLFVAALSIRRREFS
jgi:ABC-type transport system involved in multi-copper enzyme maturation permease subunit